MITMLYSAYFKRKTYDFSGYFLNEKEINSKDVTKAFKAIVTEYADCVMLGCYASSVSFAYSVRDLIGKEVKEEFIVLQKDEEFIAIPVSEPYVAVVFYIKEDRSPGVLSFINAELSAIRNPLHKVWWRKIIHDLCAPA